MINPMPPLEVNEKIIWEGAPVQGFRMGIESIAMGIFAGALLLACLGMGTVLEREIEGMFWTIVGPGLIIAAILFGIFPFFDMWRRSRTRYVLTTKRGIIIAPMRGVKTTQTENGYPIDDPDKIIYKPGPPDDVYFGRRTRSTGSGPKSRSFYTGFETLADGAQVHKLLLEIAEGNKA